MKIVVAIKRVIDYKTHIRVKADETGVETAHVKMSMNPFDEIALEEAVRLKEKGLATEIIAVSIGTLACQETLRTALAMGADRALLIETPAEIQALTAAKILKVIVQRESPHLVLLGKQAIDYDNNQTGQMLAGLLGWPQGTFASKVELNPDCVLVTREVDGGLQTLRLTLPAVITSDLRLNEPRYISLPAIVQAKRKTMDTIAFNELGIDTHTSLEIIKVTAPKIRARGIKVASVAELVDKLKNTARVL